MSKIIASWIYIKMGYEPGNRCAEALSQVAGTALLLSHRRVSGTCEVQVLSTKRQ